MIFSFIVLLVSLLASVSSAPKPEGYGLQYPPTYTAGSTGINSVTGYNPGNLAGYGGYSGYSGSGSYPGYGGKFVY